MTRADLAAGADASCHRSRRSEIATSGSSAAGSDGPHRLRSGFDRHGEVLLASRRSRTSGDYLVVVEHEDRRLRHRAASGDVVDGQLDPVVVGAGQRNSVSVMATIRWGWSRWVSRAVRRGSDFVQARSRCACAGLWSNSYLCQILTKVSCDTMVVNRMQRHSALPRRTNRVHPETIQQTAQGCRAAVRHRRDRSRGRQHDGRHCHGGRGTGRRGRHRGRRRQPAANEPAVNEPVVDEPVVNEPAWSTNGARR